MKRGSFLSLCAAALLLAGFAVTQNVDIRSLITDSGKIGQAVLTCDGGVPCWGLVSATSVSFDAGTVPSAALSFAATTGTPVVANGSGGVTRGLGALVATTCVSDGGGTCKAGLVLPAASVGTEYLWVDGLAAKQIDGGHQNGAAAKLSCGVSTLTGAGSSAAFKAYSALETLAYTDAGTDAAWSVSAAVVDGSAVVTAGAGGRVRTVAWKVTGQFVGEP